MSVGHGWGRGQVGPGARFLDPAVLQRIGSLELIAKTVVEGFMQGLHPSPFLGQSVDFAEHRPYTVGDDPRRVDWRVYARTGRYYVKEFEAETNTNFTVYMDTSRSMGFGSPVTKLDYGKFLAASLAFLARRQGDRVGCITFDRAVRDLVPCSARHLERVLLTISRAKAERSGDLAPALRDAAGRRGRKGIIGIVSDLYVEPEELRLPITRLREMGNDVMVFHVLDPAERDLPYDGPFTLEDMETGEVLPLVPKELKEEYRNLVTAHVAKVAKILGGAGADHILADTSRPLDQALFHYLLARQYRKRSGRWASAS
jgi:uncharacterized protein (DUF58 family)